MDYSKQWFERLFKDNYLKEQIATQLSEESMRMIGLMPRWMPGKMNGKSCNVRYSMPILFP